MIKHDSLDKAPLNDDALSRQQNLYGGSSFTSHNVYILSCPWAQNLPGDILDGGLLHNKIVYYTPVTTNCFHIEM